MRLCSLCHPNNDCKHAEREHGLCDCCGNAGEVVSCTTRMPHTHKEHSRMTSTDMRGLFEQEKNLRTRQLKNAECEYLRSSGWIVGTSSKDGLIWRDNLTNAVHPHAEALRIQKERDGT